jgi:hypothetical protein
MKKLRVLNMYPGVFIFITPQNKKTVKFEKLHNIISPRIINRFSSDKYLV